MPFEKGTIPEGAQPFPPGESGNPNGRPKGTQNSATRLRRLLDLTQKKKNLVTGEMEELTVLEQMDMAIVAKAIKGKLPEYKEILDRLEGRAKQGLELTGKDGAPIQTNSVHEVVFKKFSDNTNDNNPDV